VPTTEGLGRKDGVLMPHYRTMLTSEHFCAADLYSEQRETYLELDVEILEVRKGEVVGEKGRKKGMPFITMRSIRSGRTIEKKLGLNATNCETIKSLTGSPEVNRWLGQLITLHVVETEMGREKRDAIRIRPTAPQGQGPTMAPPPLKNALNEPPIQIRTTGASQPPATQGGDKP
jgi:hypothetical protein